MHWMECPPLDVHSTNDCLLSRWIWPGTSFRRHEAGSGFCLRPPQPRMGKHLRVWVVILSPGEPGVEAGWQGQHWALGTEGPCCVETTPTTHPLAMQILDLLSPAAVLGSSPGACLLSHSLCCCPVWNGPRKTCSVFIHQNPRAD